MKCGYKRWKKDSSFVLAGVLAGFANGFFGGGGGTLLVPMLKDVCGLDAKSALATSVAVIAPVCAFSAAVYFFTGGLELSAVWPYALGGLGGGALGGILLKKVRPELAVKLFAGVMIAAGVRLLWVR